MKKTCLALASLTAIILLSCSSLDNSNSSMEDVNYQQVTTLKKDFTSTPLYEVQVILK